MGPLDILLAVGRFDPGNLPPDGDDRELPASVHRCKGIVFPEDAPTRPLALGWLGEEWSSSRSPPRGRARRAAKSWRLARSWIDTNSTGCSLRATPAAEDRKKP